MIVVAIISLMAAIGIPSFRGLMPRIKLRNNAMVMSNEVALARVRAISKSYDFRIVFNPAPANSYTIFRYRTAPGRAWAPRGSPPPSWSARRSCRRPL